MEGTFPCWVVCCWTRGPFLKVTYLPLNLSCTCWSCNYRLKSELASKEAHKERCQQERMTKAKLGGVSPPLSWGNYEAPSVCGSLESDTDDFLSKQEVKIRHRDPNWTYTWKTTWQLPKHESLRSWWDSCSCSGVSSALLQQRHRILGLASLQLICSGTRLFYFVKLIFIKC